MGVLTPADENGGALAWRAWMLRPVPGLDGRSECCTHDLRRGLLSLALRAWQTIELRIFSEELPSQRNELFRLLFVLAGPVA